ncbi:uncharacterized protein LOC129612945 [Condylostylus longicornis]|uniref:uncharacterized protein LOC129612945 n=1 Tax=Condylostylus longicornis TaxID=2530218 RepID=UPI00244DF7DE|nr:uncharacterized protein LOC129612945 [Condylostylus longicornis]
MYSYFMIITTFTVILSNIHLGNGIETYTTFEGESIVLQCRFNIADYDRDDLEIFWLYPDDTDYERIKWFTEFQRNSLLTFIEINNVTKIKDSGNYSCILNNKGEYLTEKFITLEIQKDNVITNDEIDGRIHNFNTISNNGPENLFQNDTFNKIRKIQNTENVEMKETTNQNNENIIIPIIAGVSALIIAILFIFVIVLLIVVRRKLKSKSDTKTESSVSYNNSGKA